MSEVETIVAQINELGAEEFRQVRAAVESRAQTEDEKIEQFRQKLKAAGIVPELADLKARRARDFTSRQLAICIGEPVSETIIRERR